MIRVENTQNTDTSTPYWDNGNETDQNLLDRYDAAFPPLEANTIINAMNEIYLKYSKVTSHLYRNLTGVVQLMTPFVPNTDHFLDRLSENGDLAAALGQMRRAIESAANSSVNVTVPPAPPPAPDVPEFIAGQEEAPREGMVSWLRGKAVAMLLKHFGLNLDGSTNPNAPPPKTDGSAEFHEPNEDDTALAQSEYEAGMYRAASYILPKISIPPSPQCEATCEQKIESVTADLYTLCQTPNCMPCNKCVDYLEQNNLMPQGTFDVGLSTGDGGALAPPDGHSVGSYFLVQKQAAAANNRPWCPLCKKTGADPGKAFIPLNGEQMSCANAMLTCAREQDCLTYYNKYHEPDLGSCGDFQQWAWDAGCCP